ncbi:MAG: NADH:flavin oxidoreductase, partial [Halanaerobiales bacterium]
MTEIRKFNYRSLTDLKNEIDRLGLEIPIADSFEILGEEVCPAGKSVIPNRLAVHPMEGADANPDGTPGELSFRRYKRYAAGGAGLIWFEAVAVNEMGRANDLQCFLNRETVGSFKKIVDMIRETAGRRYGDEFSPYLVIQLTHVGRFGRHNKILFHHDLVDNAPAAGIPEGHPVMEDEELEELEEHFLEAARLAEQAGFDAVDI